MSALRSDQALITVVHNDGCHYCDDAIAALRDLATVFPLRVSTVDADRAEGAALLAEHRVPMLPLVLVDGRFFSFGRLPRRKLAAQLQSRTAAGTP